MNEIMKDNPYHALKEADDLTKFYLEHYDQDGKIRNQINLALMSSEAFPETIDKNFINETYLKNYFLPVLTKHFAANQFSPVAYIDPPVWEQLKH